MRIHCPLCGTRGTEEFVYHGDATLQRPDRDAGPEVWTSYVYLRDNPQGRHSELWYHGSGCQSWLTVERDVRSHEVFSARLARAVALSRDAEAR